MKLRGNYKTKREQGKNNKTYRMGLSGSLCMLTQPPNNSNISKLQNRYSYNLHTYICLSVRGSIAWKSNVISRCPFKASCCRLYMTTKAVLLNRRKLMSKAVMCEYTTSSRYNEDGQ